MTYEETLEVEYLEAEELQILQQIRSPKQEDY